MNTPEHAFALFIEANPVADPDALAGTAEREDAVIRVVDEAAPDARAVAPRGGLSRRRGWKPATVAAAAVLLVGAISLGALVYTTTLSDPVAAEAAQMSVVFDGSSCIYTGPTELLAGDGVVTFERLPGVEPFAAVVGMIRDAEGRIDAAAAEEWAATHQARDVPPWLSNIEVDYLDDDVPTLQLPVTFAAIAPHHRYVITCNTAPEGTDRVHFGAIVTVSSG